MVSHLPRTARASFSLQAAFLLGVSFGVQVRALYYPVCEYKGSSFFDRWDFYEGVDNTTLGNVMFVDRANATDTKLAYVNAAGHAIMKVDNTTTIQPASFVTRPSIRVTSQDTYGEGNIIIIDAIHIPYGCSVWPAFWTLGKGLWPNGGEIDIIEAINMMGINQYALHTTAGCFLSNNANQTGRTVSRDCSQGTRSGCVIAETKPNSFGAGFAEAGGGVFATQFDVSGVYFWFWSRLDIPEGINSATATSTLDPSTWGPPSAAFPNTTCDYTEFFTPQQLVFTISLCGVWAGIPSIYQSTCPTGGKAPDSCVVDNVIGPGSPKFDNAYWEVSYIRAYVAENSQPGSPGSSSASSGSNSSNSSVVPQTTGGNSAAADTSLLHLTLLFVALVCVPVSLI